MNNTAAFNLATEIAWQGHASTKTIETLANRAGVALEDIEQVLDTAIAVGMIVEVPRIGGYTAGRKVNEEIFGKKFAEAVYVPKCYCDDDDCPRSSHV